MKYLFTCPVPWEVTETGSLFTWCPTGYQFRSALEVLIQPSVSYVLVCDVEPTSHNYSGCTSGWSNVAAASVIVEGASVDPATITAVFLSTAFALIAAWKIKLIRSVMS